MNIKFLLCCALSCALLNFACKGNLKGLIPSSLDEKGNIPLLKIYEGEDSAVPIQDDHLVTRSLAEMGPEEMVTASYMVDGITIVLAIVRCTSADDAYGIYSSLTALPRMRWEVGAGEMSYRSPYVSGCSGEYAFFIFSPTNPMNYGEYYPESGRKIIARFNTLKKDTCSYHWKILPLENRYADSMVYIKSREILGLRVTGAYAATYQVRRGIARIYVQKFMLADESRFRYEDSMKKLRDKKNSPVEFIPLPGAPVHACWWRDDGGLMVMCRYRWLLFLYENINSLDDMRNFTRVMFRNMQGIRGEVMHAEAE